MEGRGRKSREHNNGASGVTVTRETYWSEAEERLMEEIVSRANMQKAYNRVVSNKGAAGVDSMTTGQLERIPANRLATHQRRTAERDIHTPTGTESRNPQTGRRDTDAGHPHRP